MPTPSVLSRGAAIVEPLGDPQLHADGELLQLAFAPDGSLWTVEDPGILRRWDPRTGTQRDWQALSDLETLWCFSSDARVLASGSDDLTIWDTSSGQALTSVPQRSWVTALAFAPDASFVATGHDDGSISYWDAPGHHRLFGKALRRHEQPISALAISRDGKQLAAASEDLTISLWDLADGRHIGDLRGHTDRIPALVWDGDDLLISAGWDTTARIWDVRTQQPKILINTHSTQVSALAFDSTKQLLASADSVLTVHVWDLKGNKELHRLAGARGEVAALAFSPDGTRLAAASERTVHLWDPIKGSAFTGSGHAPVALTRLAVSPDGSRLATNGGTAPRIWDTGKRTPILDLAGTDAVHDLEYSPDGKRVAGAVGNAVRIWDAGTGKILANWDGPHDPITAVAFSRDGSALASASREGLEAWVWRTADGEPMLLIPDALEGCAVEALAFHPAGKLLAVGGVDWLATGGTDGAVSLWDIAGRHEVDTYPEGSIALAFNATGDRLASATLTQSICIWDVSAQKLQLVQEMTGHDSTVTCLAYSPDGRWLATGSDDHTLRLWDAQGEQRAVIELDSRLTALAFAPDGRFLFTAHANTTCGKVAVDALLAAGG
jgi:WD40 repeat protein